MAEAVVGTAGLREELGGLSPLPALVDAEAAGLLALAITGTAGLTAVRRAGATGAAELLSALLLTTLLMTLKPPPPPAPLTPPDIDCLLDRIRL